MVRRRDERHYARGANCDDVPLRRYRSLRTSLGPVRRYVVDESGGGSPSVMSSMMGAC